MKSAFKLCVCCFLGGFAYFSLAQTDASESASAEVSPEQAEVASTLEPTLGLPSNQSVLEKRLNLVQKELVQAGRQVKEDEDQLAILKQAAKTKVLLDARVIISVSSTVGPRFVFESAQYRLDGVLVVEQAKENIGHKLVWIYDKYIPEGAHSVEVEITLRGNGAPFSYFGDEKFVLTKKVNFVSRVGTNSIISVSTFEKGNLKLLPKDTLDLAVKVGEQPGQIGPGVLSVADIAMKGAGGLSHEPILKIVVREQPGSRFLRDESKAFLDGLPLSLSPSGEVLYEGDAPEGKHTLEVELAYRGKDGPFNYFSDYSYTLKFKNDLVLKVDHLAIVDLSGFERQRASQ